MAVDAKCGKREEIGRTLLLAAGCMTAGQPGEFMDDIGLKGWVFTAGENKKALVKRLILTRTLEWRRWGSNPRPRNQP
jgi:hypothetical protein